MSEITIEQFKRLLPAQLKTKITQEMVDNLNSFSSDPQFAESFRENLLGYTNVMQNGNYNIPAYISACKYVSYKLLGSSNIEAYSKTFPDRINRLLSEGNTEQQIHKFVVAYNRTQLVNKIMEQTLVPTHVLNADVFQRAINIQAQIMVDPDASYKVRSDAANSLMTHLKPPEKTKIELDIGYKQDSSIDDLRRATQELVNTQRMLLEKGVVSSQDIAESDIVEGELVE